VTRIRSSGTDLLVGAWRLLASGARNEAREKLLLAWQHYMDGLQPDQAGRVAYRLFERLGFLTDDPEAWTQLPDPVTVYRAGAPTGLAWTTERETAEFLARQHDLTPVTQGTVAKQDVLAYITGRGEAEIVARPRRVRYVSR
jgi:hypothetical protein